MRSSAYVGFDLGAESGRGVVGRFDGDRLALSEARRFANRAVRLPDGLYWDVLGLFGEICSALGELHRAGDRVSSIGVDSWGCDFGLIDRDGVLVSNPLHHRDGRGAGEMKKAFARVPAEEIYETTGIQFLPFNTLFQLLALEQSAALESAETLLLIPDLLGYWLTGERLAEATNASTTQLLDVHTGRWSGRLISRLGLDKRLFPAVREPGEPAGSLLPHLAESTGLPPSTPVIAVASHDTASAVVAVPFESGAGAAYISSGTWSLVGVEIARAIVSDRARAANLTNERGFAGTVRLLKNVMGLWLVQECRHAWVAEGAAPDYADMVELAREAPPGGPLFDPDVPELLAPGHMPARIRAVCEQCGQLAPDERAVLIRSVFESLACKYRLVLEEIEQVTGTPIEVVHVIGGGARNEFLCRLTANVTRRPVLAGPIEAAALGNILVQLHASGELGSLAEMRELVRASTKVRAYEPDAGASQWESLYDRFLHVVRPGLVGQEVAR
ncbi:MAG TPA: rhamnulokinase family protein [Gaiellaceae bacterium]|nr:rhamnulokinase family protein [Gaiellaceae bacterium]